MTESDVHKMINWIKGYFEKNSFAKGVVVGMSGGKDSFVTAGLFVKALGKDRVFGVILPNNKMADKNEFLEFQRRFRIKRAFSLAVP